MSEYNVMEELMKYYYWEYISAYCFLAIAIVVTVVAIKHKEWFKYACIITLLCGVAMFGKTGYQGILADNGANTYSFMQTWIIDFLLLGLWLYQIYAMLKYKNK